MFTTSAFDNIDHNPKSTTAKYALHGTAISITQHSDIENEGIKRNVNVFSKTASNSAMGQVPEWHSQCLDVNICGMVPLKATAITTIEPMLT